MRAGRQPAAHDLGEAPGRDQCPDSLEEEEAELLLVPSEDREDRRADQIENQIDARGLIEIAELRRRVGRQDQDRPDDLDYLVDRRQP
jgi:hypothetical protein